MKTSALRRAFTHAEAEIRRLHGLAAAERRAADAIAARADAAEARCDQLNARVAAMSEALRLSRAPLAERIRLSHEVHRLRAVLAEHGIDPATGQPAREGAA